MDEDFDLVTLPQLGHRQSMSVWIGFFVNHIEIEVLGQIGRHDFQVRFSKCFPEANSLPAIKRAETHRMSFFAVWSEGKRVIGVESLRQKLCWTLPLIFVAVKASHVDKNVVSRLDMVLSDPTVLTKDCLRGYWYNRHETKSFIYDTA